MTVVIVTMAIESTLLLLLLLLPMLLPPLPACGLDADDVQGCEVIGDPLSPVCPMMLYNPAKMPGFSRECLARNLAVQSPAPCPALPPPCVHARAVLVLLKRPGRGRRFSRHFHHQESHPLLRQRRAFG
jgi:hypothetical protein